MKRYKDHPVKILVIDDDEGDQFLIQDYLSEIKDYRFDVDCVSTIEEAQSKIRENSHQIYLVDYYLGATTGLDLISAFIKEGNNKPFILLTGLDSREIDEKAIVAGAYDYLPKSELNPVMLERTIRHSIERYFQALLAIEREQRFLTLFRQSVDPIYITDANFVITDINASFNELFDTKDDRIVGVPLKDLFIHDSDFNYFTRKLEKEGAVKDYITTLKRSDDEEVSVLISIAVIRDEQQTITAYQGVLHDMTQLKKAERRAMAAEKVSLTGKMARMIGHEVRNPLTNINLAASQLKEEIPLNQDEAHLYMDMIQRNSTRISEMIDQLLVGTRLKEIDPKTIDLQTVVDAAVAFSADRFSLKGIAVENVPYEEEALIEGDAEQLQIVLVNLFTNATEAMEDIDRQGKISVVLTADDDYYVVNITDNGKGMDNETLRDLFQPFFTKRTGGMGLGMTTVHNVVHLHLGKIEVESEVGKGTTFSISIPKSKIKA